MKIKKWFTKIGFYEKGILRDYLVIIVGAFIMAMGLALFLVDARVVPGGVSGLSMALFYLSGGKGDRALVKTKVEFRDGVLGDPNRGFPRSFHPDPWRCQ